MSAPEVERNAERYDPYKSFKFRVMWDGKYIAGFSKVGGLTRTTQVVTHRDGSLPSLARKSPGQVEYGAVALERGVTYDPAFGQWANKVWTYGKVDGQAASLKDFRKDLLIELFNEAGRKVLGYMVYRCWVSEFQATPELDANGNAVAIQSLKLENEGWERDADVAEPKEPSLEG